MLASHNIQTRVLSGGCWFLLVLSAAALAQTQGQLRTPESRGVPDIRHTAKAPGAKSSQICSPVAHALALAVNERPDSDEPQTDPGPSEKTQSAIAFEEGKYYVVGSVVDEETKLPIAGASLCFLIQGVPNPRKKLVRATTDEKGRFQVAVPVGNLRVWLPELKAGYSLNPADKMKQLATSVDKPVVTLDLEAKRWPVWPV